ncbi:FtsJ-like methyltransferase [Mactra antiquata]
MASKETWSCRRKRKLSDSVSKLSCHRQTFIESLFEKKFSYEASSDWVFNSDRKSNVHLFEEWSIHENIAMKNELNLLKTDLNDKDMLTWHNHTREVNLAGNIAVELRNRIRPELCTQAWCKFYEIASRYIDLEKTESLYSVHLCEAPGAFITSLNHFLYSHNYTGQWHWLASTLNPYYEGNSIKQMIDEDRFIRCSVDNWYFGEDGTGNLMVLENLEGLRSRLCGRHVNLVTADGSIDCQGDPAEQENIVSRLQHCEVFTALNILSPGGTLIVKMFTMFECKAISLMYLLNCVFEKVDVFKPSTSKGGNSEVYVVGIGYKGRSFCNDWLEIVCPLYFGKKEPQGCLFSKEKLPQSFLDQHSRCVEFFKDCQMTSIQRNLDLFKVISDEERSRMEAEKDYCVECFFNRYLIKPLAGYARIMNTSKRRIPNKENKSEFATRAKLEGKFTGTFQERLKLSTSTWHERLNSFDTYENDVCKDDNSLWIHCPNGILSDLEISYLHKSHGKQVDVIHSSRFCDGFYLARVQDIFDNVEWLSLPYTINEDFIEKIVRRCKSTIQNTVEYYTNTRVFVQNNGGINKIDSVTNHSHSKNQNYDGSDNMDSEENKSMLTDPKTKKNGGSDIIDCTESVSMTTDSSIDDKRRIEIKYDVIQSGSRILDKLNDEKLCESQDTIDVVTVRLYNIISDSVIKDLEIKQQMKLYNVILNVLKNCHRDDYVIIEMGTCLTRFTAGLIYILYRSFKEIGFVHHHGNLLCRHLMCVGYLDCPIKLLHYMEDIDHVVKNSLTDCVLEIVPILMMLNDTEFTSFLRISNVNLLQSFITTVVNKEKKDEGK